MGEGKKQSTPDLDYPKIPVDLWGDYRNFYYDFVSQAAINQLPELAQAAFPAYFLNYIDYHLISIMAYCQFIWYTLSDCLSSISGDIKSLASTLFPSAGTGPLANIDLSLSNIVTRLVGTGYGFDYSLMDPLTAIAGELTRLNDYKLRDLNLNLLGINLNLSDWLKDISSKIFLSDLHLTAALSQIPGPDFSGLENNLLGINLNFSDWLKDISTKLTSIELRLKDLATPAMTFDPLILTKGIASLLESETSYYASPEKITTTIKDLWTSATAKWREFNDGLSRKVLKTIIKDVDEEEMIATQKWIKEKVNTRVPLDEQIIGIFKDLVGGWWGEINKIITGGGMVTPGMAPGIAGGLLTFATAAGVGAHGSAALLELIHPLKNMGLSAIPALLADMGSFSRIGAASLGVAVSEGLGTPFRYWIHDKTRPTIPDPLTLQEMAVKEIIGSPEFRQDLAYHGFSEYWINSIEENMYREPRPADLTWMLEDANASDLWLKTKARRYGFDEEDAEMIKTTLVKKMLKSPRASYLSAAMKSYQEGYVDEAQFDWYLRELDLRPEAHDLVKKTCKLTYQHYYVEDLVKLYTDQYMKEVITEGGLWCALASLGLTSEKINLLLEKAKIQKKPKPTQPVKTEYEKQMSELQAKYITLYIEQYRKDVISEQTLFTNLVSLGVVAELATVTVSLEKTRKLKPTKIEPAVGLTPEEEKVTDLYQDLYLVQFRKDLINADQLRSSLAALGLHPELVEGLVDLEIAKKYKPEPVEKEIVEEYPETEIQSSYKTYYLTQFRKNLIDSATLRSSLLDLGFHPDLVTAWVKLEELKKMLPLITEEPIQPKLPEGRIESTWTTYWVTAFRKDLITESTLTIELTNLGVHPDLVSAIVELEVLRKVPATAT